MPYEDSFAALGHPLRQSILKALGSQPASVRELTDRFEASQPVISQHLKVLRQAGLVTHTPQGNKNIYQIDPDALAALRAYLDQHWSKALQNLDRSETRND